MCHRYEALPAITPIAGAAVDVEDLTLTASDGTEFAAFHARAESPTGPGMVILPDVRGLFRFYEELAIRFAEVGVDSVAIDYFGRTAGNAKRDAEFDFWPHVRSTTAEGIVADTAAAVAVLRANDPDRAVFTVGFCFGGSNSWLQASSGHGLAGAIGFYGRPTAEGLNGAPAPSATVSEIECPILGLMGGADEGIPAEAVAEWDAALQAGGITREIITYEGAPHSFFDRTYDEHVDACNDAWQRIQSFIAANS
ncbi:MAG: dienelactone hydrolase family protein [Chloroflexi bacterium]|nr:dienelactone hydrolase family protein [Chloroflexota bacterium]